MCSFIRSISLCYTVTPYQLKFGIALGSHNLYGQVTWNTHEKSMIEERRRKKTRKKKNVLIRGMENLVKKKKEISMQSLNHEELE